MWAYFSVQRATEAGPYKTRTGTSHGVKGGSRAFAERRCLSLRWKECAKCTRLTLSERGGRCSGFSRMQLKMQVQSERFVLMLAFMIDLHEVLKGVSECFQADKTTLADVGQREG